MTDIGTVLKYPWSILKRMDLNIPAYGRYWTFIGFAKPSGEDLAEVLVYGPWRSEYSIPVGMRKRA